MYPSRCFLWSGFQFRGDLCNLYTLMFVMSHKLSLFRYLVCLMVSKTFSFLSWNGKEFDARSGEGVN
jgi:hypothetical protein